MRFDHFKSLCASAVVFVILSAAGFSLSERKLLWNDELFTQQTAIEAHSYTDLLLLRFPDGNKNPFFYVVQKAVCNVFSYHLPPAYLHQLYRTGEIRSQIVLRLPSDIYMSLALALMFYFLARFFSVGAALYGLAVALVSPMVWMYWVEARPYPLWFLLTTIQLLFVCRMGDGPRGAKRVTALLITHLLLAFTTPASLLQIAIATLMAGWKGKYTPRQLILIWLPATAVALFYYFADAQFRIHTYLFGPNFFDVVMPERLFMAVIYALMAGLARRKNKDVFTNAYFLVCYGLFVASALAVLCRDLFVPIATSESGFYSRYLIYVVPADILMYVFVSIDFYRASRRYPWVCMNVSIFLAGLVLVRGLITYRSILSQATYLHVPG